MLKYMRIISIHIEEFAGLRDKKLAFSDGLNLLVGENESGKSTVCAFIKFILYGHDAKERRLYASKNGICRGSMTLLHSDQKTYRIMRSEIGARSILDVFCEDDAEIRKDIKNIGEYFLRTPKDLYGRSLFISQKHLPQKDSSELTEQSSGAIRNILSSGDDKTNVKRAIDKLDKKRKELKPENRDTGKISELEWAITEKKSALTEAINKRDTSGLLQEQIDEYSEKLSKVSSDIAKKEAFKKLVKYKKICDIQNELTLCTHSLNELKKQDSSIDPIWENDEYLRHLRSLSVDTELKLQRAKDKECSALYRPMPPRGYEALGKSNSEAELKSKWQANQKAKRNSLMLAIFMYVVGAVLLALTFISVAFAPFGAVFIVPGIISTVKHHRLNRALSEQGYRDLDEITLLYKSFSEYETVLERYNNYENELSKLRSDANEATLAYESELKKCGVASLNEAEKAYSRYQSEKRVAENKISAVTADINSLHRQLEAYSDDEIKAATELSQSGKFDDPITDSISTNIEMLKMLEDGYRSKLSDLKEQKARSEGEAPIDTARLSMDISSLEEELERCKTDWDAVKLAIDSLKAAEESLRKSFIPQIAELGSRYFSHLTSDSYSSVRLSPDFEVICLAPEGEPTTTAHLSGGSYDLAWFCLRLALCARLSDIEPIPMILDEPFVYFDDVRLRLTLELLKRISDEGTQILLFSASDREERVLGEEISLISM